jgi:formylmethanofuran dehydrogenase subunit B
MKYIHASRQEVVAIPYPQIKLFLNIIKNARFRRIRLRF